MSLTLITDDIPARGVCVAWQRSVKGMVSGGQESVFLAGLAPLELKAPMAGLAKTIRPALDSVHYTPVCESDLRLSSG